MKQGWHSEFWVKARQCISRALWPFFWGGMAFIGISLWSVLSISTAARDLESGAIESKFLGLHLHTVMVEGNVRTLTPEWGLAMVLLACLVGSLCIRLSWRRLGTWRL